MRKLFTYIGTGTFCPVLLRPAIDSSHEPSTVFRNMVLLSFQSLDSTLVNPFVKNVYNSIRLIGDIFNPYRLCLCTVKDKTRRSALEAEYRTLKIQCNAHFRTFL